MVFSFDTVMSAWSQMSRWEILAAVLGVIYVFLAAKESLWAWLFAFLSTIIYTVLFWEGALVSSSALNLYYMGMALYGYITWRNGGLQGEQLEISRWSFKKHILVMGMGALLSLMIGYVSATQLDARFAYLDASVMVFSMVATWMLANKILENWLYWLIVDSAAVVLYYLSGYFATVMLFVLYVILALYGFVSWYRSHDKG